MRVYNAALRTANIDLTISQQPKPTQFGAV